MVAGTIEGTRDSRVDPFGELARMLAGGDLNALEPIWDRCSDDLYGIALYRTGSAGEAEDAVQDVFVRLARRPEALARAKNPRTYLRRMAHNAAIDVIKRRRPSESLERVAEALAGTEDSADDRIDARRAVDLLAELPAAQRETVYLRHFEGLSFREIGVVTGVPTFTASGRYRLALRKLAKGMGVSS